MDTSVYTEANRNSDESRLDVSSARRKDYLPQLYNVGELQLGKSCHFSFLICSHLNPFYPCVLKSGK